MNPPYIFLEQEYLTDNEYKKITDVFDDSLKNYFNFEYSLFESYIYNKLKENISKEKLILIGQNIFYNKILRQHLIDKYVDIISGYYIKNTNFDKFYYLLSTQEKNRYISSLLIHRLAFHISHMKTPLEAKEILINLSYNSEYNKYHLLYILSLAYIKSNQSTKIINLFSLLNYLEKFEFMAASCYNGNSTLVFKKIQAFLEDNGFFNYCKFTINDEDSLCKSIRSLNSLIISPFHSDSINFYMKEILFQHPTKISKTINHLLFLAQNDNDLELIIELARCFSKKKILTILLSYNNTFYLNKFLSIYKDDPEIRNIISFI